MEFKQGHALLVGVSTYQHHSNLDVPIATVDAEGVASIIRDPDFCGYPASQVKVLSTDAATKDGILSALDELAGQVGPDDTVFFFHCGHGTLGTDGEYYLVSHDARVEGKRVKAGTGVSEPELLDKLRQIQAKRLLMVFNSCYSGHISPALDVGEGDALDLSNPGADTATALLGTGSGRIIMAACREGQVSFIGRGENSIFTAALMDGLRGRGVRSNQGYISAFNLYEHLYDTVTEVVREDIQEVQEPELTVLKGVGPFAVSLYKGATALGAFDDRERVREGLPVQPVSVEKSQRYFEQRVVHTGGGAYIEGKVDTGGGDFVGRDKIARGDEVRGDKVLGDKVGGDKISIGDVGSGAAVAAGRGAEASVTSGISGDQLDSLFSPLFSMLRQADDEKQAAALQQAEALKSEVAKGDQADDARMAQLIDDLAELVPGAVSALVSMFASPILGGIAGPVTKYALGRLQGK